MLQKYEVVLLCRELWTYLMLPVLVYLFGAYSLITQANEPMSFQNKSNVMRYSMQVYITAKQNGVSSFFVFFHSID